MKKTKRLWALLLAMVMALGLITTAFAAPTIDSGRKASLSLYKYDITAASADGAWDAASYVSTGVQDDAVTDKLAKYAIQGVEFSYLRVASISTYSQRENGQYKVGVLYGFADDAVLQAIGLTKADAYKRGNGVFYFTSDKLNKALADALAANATTVKNALETAARNGGNALPETDASGHSKVSGLEQGLYLVVETHVPENVISTCNPFFVSLPMTTIDGKDWNYDVTVYPKNQTGNPTLEKTVREDKNSTGKNGGTADIADGYAHTATASVGDVVEYQIISTLPTITSKATSLTTYTFVDTLREGIRYNRSDVVIEFFRDAGCTDQITAWDEDSGKFAVSYDDAQNTMTIGMTETGLADINESASVYTDSVKRGYSDCTMRITYAATLTADAQLGDSDNPNEVVLTWKRTSQNSYDTLKDDARVFTYGLELTKLFSDGKGDFSKVQFTMQNKTDGYYVKAKLDEATGVYYVTDHVADKKDATRFVPTVKDGKGKILIKGLEDDEYTVTEIKTADGYTLLKKGIAVVISRKDASTSATVDGKQAAMLADNGSANALVPLSVVNTSGFDLPATGDRGVGMYGLAGILLMTASAACIIITGHSGMASQKMFTDLEQLREGDIFYLHVLDETLAYEVREIHTVLPHDTTYLGIEPGEDLCTLVTCTPTGVNTHRLLVQGSRIPYVPTEETEASAVPHEENTDSNWEKQYWLGVRLGLAAMVFLTLVAGVVLYIRRNRGRAVHRKGGRYVRK